MDIQGLSGLTCLAPIWCSGGRILLHGDFEMLSRLKALQVANVSFTKGFLNSNSGMVLDYVSDGRLPSVGALREHPNPFSKEV
jgi:hypothetical protein